jgi:hypothetical protein
VGDRNRAFQLGGGLRQLVPQEVAAAATTARCRCSKGVAVAVFSHVAEIPTGGIAWLARLIHRAHVRSDSAMPVAKATDVLDRRRLSQEMKDNGRGDHGEDTEADARQRRRVGTRTCRQADGRA